MAKGPTLPTSNDIKKHLLESMNLKRNSHGGQDPNPHAIEHTFIDALNNISWMFSKGLVTKLEDMKASNKEIKEALTSIAEESINEIMKRVSKIDGIRHYL